MHEETNLRQLVRGNEEETRKVLWTEVRLNNERYGKEVRAMMTVLWDTVPCSLIAVDQCFRSMNFLHQKTDEI